MINLKNTKKTSEELLPKKKGDTTNGIRPFDPISVLVSLTINLYDNIDSLSS